MSNWKELDGMDEEVPADLNLKRMIDSIREAAEDAQADRAEAVRATVVKAAMMAASLTRRLPSHAARLGSLISHFTTVARTASARSA